MFLEADRHRFGRDVGDDFQQHQIAFEIGFRRHQPVDAQRADDPFHMDDRHADEGDFAGFLARPGPVEEAAVSGDVRHHLRFAGFRNVSGNSFAEMIAAALFFTAVDAVGGFDRQRVALQQREGAPQHIHAEIEHRQNFVQQFVNIAFVDDG